jgi:hypothetical protein
MNIESFSPLTDKKKIKVGSNWFMFKFFADGTIEKNCFTFEQHEINADFSATEAKCRLCDYTEENQ